MLPHQLLLLYTSRSVPRARAWTSFITVHTSDPWEFHPLCVTKASFLPNASHQSAFLNAAARPRAAPVPSAQQMTPYWIDALDLL